AAHPRPHHVHHRASHGDAGPRRPDPAARRRRHHRPGNPRRAARPEPHLSRVLRARPRSAPGAQRGREPQRGRRARGRGSAMSGPHQGSAGIRWPSVTRVYRVFGRHYRDHLRGIAIAYLGLSLTVVFALLSPWPLKLILDHVVLGAPLPARVRFLERVAGSDRIALLGVLVAAFVLVRMSDSLAGYLHKVGLLTVGEKLSRDVRNRIFAHLQRLSMAFHGRAATGDLVYRMASDVGDLRVLMIEVPDLMLYRLLTLASHAALMLALEWR